MKHKACLNQRFSILKRTLEIKWCNGFNSLICAIREREWPCLIYLCHLNTWHNAFHIGVQFLSVRLFYTENHEWLPQEYTASNGVNWIRTFILCLWPMFLATHNRGGSILRVKFWTLRTFSYTARACSTLDVY